MLGIEFEKKAGYGLHLNGFDGSDLNHKGEALYRDFWMVHIVPSDNDKLVLETVDPTTDPFLTTPTKIEARNAQSLTFEFSSISASLSQEKAKHFYRPAFVLSVNNSRNYVSWIWNLKTAGFEGDEYRSPKDIFIRNYRQIRAWKTKQLYDQAKYSAPLPTKVLWSAPPQFKDTVSFEIVIEQRFCSIFKPPTTLLPSRGLVTVVEAVVTLMMQTVKPTKKKKIISWKNTWFWILGLLELFLF
ncbi:8073_t:CDS:2 [Scutellospora calospora]|uniref:8073_t:CDS:1 n=1 Tax=Scutellospora calospora TaxID=85575 RepID=A0ACA9N1D6_9GLOM|nr:8073_t:CDS:2 [Scutellospora calospora]